jgi:formylglycine-generating enzyme required for sulfatase activity
MSLTQKILLGVWITTVVLTGCLPAAAQGLQAMEGISPLEQIEAAMVLIPGGRFVMGSNPAELGHKKREEPQHEVQLRPFALSRTEVTFEQWDACVQDGGCSPQTEDNGWGRGKQPVFDVSWPEAQAFIVWLNRKTSRTYRLPSEAEWEYAARASTTTSFHTGATITPQQANFDGTETECAPPRCTARRKTIAVGSLGFNAFGLHDMHGNVSEWVQDCWHVDYNGAPNDGSAWQTHCSIDTRHVVRGGKWNTDAQHLRSASRNWGPTLNESGNGFRLARSLR